MWFSAFLKRDSFFTWPRTNQGSKEMHFPMVPRISVNIYNSHELRFVFYSLASAKSPPNCANPVALISPFAMRQIFRFPAENGVMSTNGVAPALRWLPAAHLADGRSDTSGAWRRHMKQTRRICTDRGEKIMACWRKFLGLTNGSDSRVDCHVL
jgi:hypothetical protein